MDSLFMFSAVALLIDTLAPDYVHYKDAEELKPLWTWMDGLNQRPTESMPRKKKMKEQIVVASVASISVILHEQ